MTRERECPNPSKRGGDGPFPLWEFTIRQYCGGDGPIPLAQCKPWYPGYGGDPGDGPTPLAYRSNSIPPADLPSLAGYPIRPLQAGWLNYGAICDTAPAGYFMFYRARGYWSLLDHKCLICTRSGCNLSGLSDPDIVIDYSTFIGPPVARWENGSDFYKETVWLAAGLTMKDQWYLNTKMYCSVWKLTNGRYYYFGFSDEGVDPVTLPGHFQVEVVLVNKWNRFSFTPPEGAAAETLRLPWN